MKPIIEAVYENGVFRPIQREGVAIPEGQRVRITITDEEMPESLRLAVSVYEGLTDDEVRDLESIILRR